MSITLASLVEKYKITPDPNGLTRCKTPVFRASYAFVHEPKETLSGDLKYTISMIFEKAKASELKVVAQAICNAAAKKFGIDHKKWTKAFKNPIRDGDEDRDDSKDYEKSLFINAGSKNKPGIVDRQMNPLMDTDEFYSGCYARGSITFYGFDVPGNKGVGCGLNNLLFWEDGERLDGSVAAENDFAEFAEEATVSEGSDDDDDIPF